MEHTIYLVAKAFIEKVKPKAPKAQNKATTKNRPASVEDSNDDDDVNDDWVIDWAQLDLIPDEQEVDDIVDFTAGDVLGKALALVNQVCLLFSSLLPFLKEMQICRSEHHHKRSNILLLAVNPKVYRPWS